ncbi:MAG: FAD-binding protein [Planctomycetota bacterium]
MTQAESISREARSDAEPNDPTDQVAASGEGERAAAGHSHAVSLQASTTDTLSHFRTAHDFEAFGEFTSVEEFLALRSTALQSGRSVFILGNGSNTLFARKTVGTAVLKNRLRRWIEPVDRNTVEVSSSCQISELIRYCNKQGLETCWYLASVPATVGGAVAMNAGRGREHGITVMDFIQSVCFIDTDGHEQRVTPSELGVSYRNTRFTGVKPELITSVIMRFPDAETDEDLARQRVRWAREHQDHSGPNCGSVFKKASPGIIRRLRGFRLLPGAHYSRKTDNWIINRSKSHRPVLWLIRIVQLLHRVRRQRAIPEVILVK